MIRIIDNRKIDLTEDEWKIYQKICRAYDIDKRDIKGEDLFTDLFETDKNGIITFLKPPTTVTSMEVFLFLVSVMVHQHLGTACDHIDQEIAEMHQKTERLDNVLPRAEEVVEKGEILIARLNDILSSLELPEEEES